MAIITNDSYRTAPSQSPALIKQILLANAKGGCGKTTLATNRANYHAVRGIPAALIDDDPQGLASEWIKRRPQTVSPVFGIEAFSRHMSGGTRSWFMNVPRCCRPLSITGTKRWHNWNCNCFAGM